ncbi:hypothetical protein QA601_06170 [Chitinispirillales bacterium ANBcel5]|nr:hypothetical protein [Chitinispirillales bacterium ANBcel5]
MSNTIKIAAIVAVVAFIVTLVYGLSHRKQKPHYDDDCCGC